MTEKINMFFDRVSKFLEEMSTPVSIITIITLIMIAVILLATRKQGKYDTKIIAYGAISMASAFILSMIKIPWLQGGSITPASMLPIFIFAYIAGPRAGILVGVCYGFLQFIQAPYFVHPVQFLLDYPLAFGFLGFAGIFRKNIFAVVFTGGILRFLCHFLSGVVFFASYAPEGQSVYIYSLIYNGTYMLSEMIICALIVVIPRMRTLIDKEKRQKEQ